MRTQAQYENDTIRMNQELKQQAEDDLKMIADGTCTVWGMTSEELKVHEVVLTEQRDQAERILQVYGR